MTLTNAPIALSAFADMVVACAAWTGGSVALWYPTATNAVSGTFMVLVLVEERRERYAEGMRGIPSGTIVAMLHADDTAGNVEQLAQTLIDQLMSQSTGLLLRGASASLCAEAGPAREAGGESRKAIDITVTYGLNA